jgi:protein gp37
MSRSAIEWTEETWNPVVGCTKVSQGCKHCYAKTLHDKRHVAALAGKMVAPQYAQPFEVVQLMGERLTKPLKKQQPTVYFVNSVSDLFHEDIPLEYIATVFAVMAATQRHTYQVLTKRPARAREFFDWFPTHYTGPRRAQAPWDSDDLEKRLKAAPETVWPLRNVWLGVSVENQKAADERIPLLLSTPAAVRWLSMEPLLGTVRIAEYLPNPLWNDLPSWRTPTLDWIVVGGESGDGARPMHPRWARDIRDECRVGSVPFFFKQWGDWAPTGSMPNYVVMERVGKKAAGRQLDGREWNEYPRELAVAP